MRCHRIPVELSALSPNSVTEFREFPDSRPRRWIEVECTITELYDRDMLRMNPEWRFESPGPISDEAVSRFRQFIDRIGWNGPRKSLFEHFKRHFTAAAGVPYYSSSSESWATDDLDRHMAEASANAPAFIDAFYSACENLKAAYPEVSAPPPRMINRALAETNAGYEIQGDELVRTTGSQPIIIPTEAPSLEEQARSAISAALAASDRALAEGNGRQAVQELLWVLESVATAFRGVELSSGTIQGSYFNQIVKELKSARLTKHQERIFEWMQTLHGYLSSPAGGGVRHGMDLQRGVAMDINEARLCCDLIKSYTAYLISEHERLRSFSH